MKAYPYFSSSLFSAKAKLIVAVLAGSMFFLCFIAFSHTANAAPAALSVEKTVDNASPVIGDSVVWTITVTDTVASTPTLTDTLPSGLIATAYATNNIAANGIVTLTEGVLTWQPDVNPAFGADMYPAILVVTTTVNSASAITNTVTADTGDSSSAAINLTPNIILSGTVVLTDTPPVSDGLTINKTVNKTDVEILDEIIYSIILTSTLTSTPVITEVVPDGLTLSTLTNNNVFISTFLSDDRRLIVWQPKVDPNESAQVYPARLDLVMTVDRNAFDDYGGVITNTVVTDGGLESSVAINIADPGDQPSVKIFKHVQDLSMPFLRGLAAGDTISFTFVISNDGEFPLFDIEVQDNQVPNIICDAEKPIALDVGESVTCTGDYRVRQSDLEDLLLDNTASVSASTNDGIIVRDTDRVNVSLFVPPLQPDLTISQTVNNLTPQPGEEILITVMLTDTLPSEPDITIDLPDGLTYLKQTNNNVRDRTEKLENGVIWKPSVDPNSSLSEYPATITITALVEDSAADLGTIAIISSVNDGSYAVNEIVITEGIALVPSVNITKTAVDTSADSLSKLTLSDIVTYRIEVENNGTAALIDLVVVDVLAPDVNCGEHPLPTTLNVGKSFTCITSHTITAEDVTRGHVNNTATVSATTLAGNALFEGDDLSLEVSPTVVSLNKMTTNSIPWSVISTVVLLFVSGATIIYFRRKQAE